MNKRQWLALFALICATVVLGTCSNAVEYAGEDSTLKYLIYIYPEPEHGVIKLSHQWAERYAYIKTYILPDSGYILQPGGLKYFERTAKPSPADISKTDSFYYQWQLRATTDVMVSAQFIPNPTAGTTYTVSVDRNIENGFIVPDIRNASGANVQTGEPGWDFTVNVFPEPGYLLQENSLVVRDEAGNTLGTIPNALPHRYQIPSPGKNIIVSAQFIQADFNSISTNARDYLENGQYDTAASFYEQAYSKLAGAANEGQKNEVIFYHSLAKLASILIQPEVRTFLGTGNSHMHLHRVPSTLDDWICDVDRGWVGDGDYEGKWYRTWRGIDYSINTELNKGYIKEDLPEWRAEIPRTTEDLVLPIINWRDGVAREVYGSFFKSFADYPIINENPDTRLKLINAYAWLMLSQWREKGFNVMLEHLEDKLLGQEFEAAAAIAATLPDNARVLLAESLKDRFDLGTKFYGTADTYVGKAELDYIFGMLRLAKASLEYLRAYNWMFEHRPWLIGGGNGLYAKWGIDQILNDTFYLGEKEVNYKGYWVSSGSIINNLPLKNRLLETRNAGFTSKSKGEFTRALGMLDRSMTLWFGNPPHSNLPTASLPTSPLSSNGFLNYRWAAGAIRSAKNALEGGGNFEFPTVLPTQPTTVQWQAVTKEYSVNTGVFFTPGAFNLSKLITLDSRITMAPRLFLIPWLPTTNSATLLPQNARLVTAPIPDDDKIDMGGGTFAPYGLYSIEVNTEYLRSIFPKGFSQTQYTEYYPAGHAERGKRALFYQVFPTIPLWPERPTYITGPGNDDNMSAQFLYNFYHK